jgi:hypothetical protein
MESIARALVFAVTYLSTREDDADSQDDVKALESIAGFLAEATDGEKDALAAAADLAHSEMVERHQHQVRRMSCPTTSPGWRNVRRGLGREPPDPVT